jgi:16S rRNA (cytosine967-C5)-methyltransferase
VCDDGAFASDCLSAGFRKRQDLGHRARITAGRRLFGMIHHARKLDFALDSASADLARRTRPYAHYLAYRLLNRELSLDQVHAALPAVNWNAVAGVDASIAREPSAERRLALSCSLPDVLAERFLAEYGADAELLGHALSGPAPLTVRANTIKISRKELATLLSESGIRAQPTRFAPDGLTLDPETETTRLRDFRNDGLFEPQDEGSQLIAALVHARAGEAAVDFCAGAGGKTLALGASMENHGQLWALSVSHFDHDELRRRVSRAGLSNIHPLAITPNSWPRELNPLRGRASRVLVDVPCSGVGALRRKPEARLRINAETLQRLPAEQLAILRQAAQLCAPGAHLIYATCTILEAENERVVEQFLNESPEFALLPVQSELQALLGPRNAAAVCGEDGRFLKLLPHQHGTDGFFAAVMCRKL